MFHVKQINLETIKSCPLCNFEAFEDHLQCQDFLTGFGFFSIVRCKKCSLHLTNPRPSQSTIDACYPALSYQSHSKTKNTSFQRVYFLVQNIMLGQKLKIVRKILKPNQVILDVGCGVGGFADFLAKKNFTVFGIEPSQNARNIAIGKGLVVYENLEQYRHHQFEKPSLITLWHVMEHQHNCFQNLREYYEVLDPSGWLIVAVPHFESLDGSFYKEYWAAYDLPRHLFHFNPQTLIFSAKNAGFAFVSATGMPFDSFYVSFLSEQNKKSKIGSIRASLIASASNLLASLKARPWSSQMFVFRKMK